jgi:hypothetical protein
MAVAGWRRWIPFQKSGRTGPGGRRPGRSKARGPALASRRSALTGGAPRPHAVLRRLGYLDGLLRKGERLPEWISPLSAVPAFKSPDFVSAR